MFYRRSNRAESYNISVCRPLQSDPARPKGTECSGTSARNSSMSCSIKSHSSANITISISLAYVPAQNYTENCETVPCLLTVLYFQSQISKQTQNCTSCLKIGCPVSNTFVFQKQNHCVSVEYTHFGKYTLVFCRG